MNETLPKQKVSAQHSDAVVYTAEKETLKTDRSRGAAAGGGGLWHFKQCGNWVSSQRTGSAEECKRNLKKMRARAKKASESGRNHQRAPSKSLPSRRRSVAAFNVLCRKLLFIQPRKDVVVFPAIQCVVVVLCQGGEKKLTCHKLRNASECINSVFQTNPGIVTLCGSYRKRLRAQAEMSIIFWQRVAPAS